MIPTLRPLDLLEVLPYGGRAVRVGDVVAFLPAGKKTHVVHRVIEVGEAWIRTLGDNNIFDDPGLLHPANISGRVIAAWRGQKRRKVYGGLAGQLLGRIVRITCSLDRFISRVLSSTYHALAKRGVLRAVLPRSLRPRVVRFKADEREQLSLLFLGHWIGHYDADLRRWVIRRPFRLFIEEALLPGQQTANS